MTKRQAKRLACFHASLVLQDALAAGWDLTDAIAVEQETLKADAGDEDRLRDSLNELVKELWLRGLK